MNTQRFFILFAFCLLFLIVKTSVINAQQISNIFGDLSSLKFSNTTGDAGILDMDEDKQGNIYVVGFFSESIQVETANYTCQNPKSTKYFFAKYDQTMKNIWLKEYIDNSKDNYIAAEKIKVDNNGNVYVLGLSKGNARFGNSPKETINTSGDAKEFLAKYNTNGVIEWVKGFQQGFYSGARDMALDEEGNVYILGFYANVAKIDAQGNEIFRVYFPNGFTPGNIAIGKNTIAILTNIRTSDSDSRYSTKQQGDFTIPRDEAKKGYFYNLDLLITTLDKQTGEMIWAKFVRGKDVEYTGGIAIQNNDDIVLLGVADNSSTFGDGTQTKLSIPESNQNHRNAPFIMGLDSKGNMKWFNTLKVEDKDGGSYSISLQLDKKTGNFFTTRAHCNKSLFWGMYIEGFDKNGKNIKYNTLGIENKQNNGFWKSSCGTANIFVHLGKHTNKSYIYGEGRSFNTKSLDFTNVFNQNKEEYWAKTRFFVAQYKKNNNSNNNNTEVESPISNTNNNNVIVYTLPNFAGRSQTLKIGRHDLESLTIGNDIIKSIKIPAGMRVTLYEHSRFQGKTMVLTKNTSNLISFNDNTSSIVVENSNINNNNSNNNNSNNNNSPNNNNSNNFSFSGCAKGTENIASASESLERQVFNIVNQERKKQGLPAFVWNENLARAARYHAGDMHTDNYFEHDSYDRINGQLVKSCDTFVRISKFGQGFAENIAVGSTTAESVMKQWMNSPGHKRNILNRNKSIGVGYYEGRWVQVFGN
ncbi:MAG: hypothetical protein EAZ06_04155 [Cytophagales bacterium]|nr:MAG: hypothetical protein EAZ06_04155 [Cytophagales bacterium]